MPRLYENRAQEKARHESLNQRINIKNEIAGGSALDRNVVNSLSKKNQTKLTTKSAQNLWADRIDDRYGKSRSKKSVRLLQEKR